MRYLCLCLLLLAACTTTTHSTFPENGRGRIAELERNDPAPYHCLCLDIDALQANEAALLACERKLKYCRGSSDYWWPVTGGFFAGIAVTILIAYSL